MLRTFKKIITGAPYLQELVRGGRKKSDELQGILDEVRVHTICAFPVD
jgi:hypothetical protein